MTDSIKLSASIEHLDSLEEEIHTLPFLVSQVVNQYGEALSSTAKPQWIESKLTGAQYQVTPVFRDIKSATKENLTGYEISINVPACVVGNNALLQILVYGCSVFALEFLKSYLLDSGCSPIIVKQLDLEHCSIKEVALTYLLECKDRAEANAYNKKLESYGEATLNTKHANLKQKKPVTAWSSAEQTTVTIYKPRDFEAKSYVKTGPTSRSFENFQSSQVRDAVYKESSCKVRLEFNADKQWLKRNNAESPLTWKKRPKAAKLIAQAFQEIKGYLRVSENLRSKRPKPEQIAKLSPAEQAILRDYFNGVDPKTHPLMTGKSPQYFSSIKRNIETKLRIDITISWAIHSTKISPDLPKWMQLPEEYQAPDHLVDHCFVRETAKAELKRLRQINASITAKRQLSQAKGFADDTGDDANETSDISDLMG